MTEKNRKKLSKHFNKLGVYNPYGKNKKKLDDLPIIDPNEENKENPDENNKENPDENNKGNPDENNKGNPDENNKGNPDGDNKDE